MVISRDVTFSEVSNDKSSAILDEVWETVRVLEIFLAKRWAKKVKKAM
jgi:hypothetical protein